VKNKIRVTSKNIKEGLQILDEEGREGIVIDYEDLHNVHVIYQGEGLLIEIQMKMVDCGGSELMCMDENCEEFDDCKIFIK